MFEDILLWKQKIPNLLVKGAASICEDSQNQSRCMIHKSKESILVQSQPKGAYAMPDVSQLPLSGVFISSSSTHCKFEL
jgi:hypothetical protein